MRNEGYIAVPRSINDLPFFAGAILHRICHKIAYRGYEHPTAGMLRPGELVTSISTLVKWLKGPSVKQVRDALDWLKDNDYIKVEATHRYTKIYVIWAEFAALNGYNIMLKDKAEGKVKGKAEGKLPVLATRDDSASYEDEKNMRANQRAMSSANQRANINNKELNNTEDNIHTHSSINLVETKNAPARETHAHTQDVHEQVQELALFVAQEVPQFEAMKHPFTRGDLTAIVEAHSLDDARAILRQAWSKEAYLRDTSARVVFKKYAKGYYAYHPQATPTENSRLLTYSEMINEFNKIGYGTTSDHFVEAGILGADGKKRWKRIS